MVVDKYVLDVDSHHSMRGLLPCTWGARFIEIEAMTMLKVRSWKRTWSKEKQGESHSHAMKIQFRSIGVLFHNVKQGWCIFHYNLHHISIAYTFITIQCFKQSFTKSSDYLPYRLLWWREFPVLRLCLPNSTRYCFLQIWTH